VWRTTCFDSHPGRSGSVATTSIDDLAAVIMQELFIPPSHRLRTLHIWFIVNGESGRFDLHARPTSLWSVLIPRWRVSEVDIGVPAMVDATIV
jgi:hypothetical protein